MRISSTAFGFLFAGLGVVACDGARALDAALSAGEAFRSGYAAYKKGDTATALEALNFAANAGHPAAMWKLGRMYATGDGVLEDDRKALELFSKVADEYADGNPRGPDAPFVADAFVTLGSYYQRGIPGTLEADTGKARRYFNYAASYFGDADAQFHLAAMYLTGDGGEADPRQAVRWFALAARKGHPAAQAELGRLFYEGIGVERDAEKGLMWLSVAQLTGGGDPVIGALHEQAFSEADAEQRRHAIAEAEDWIARRQKQ
jgi:TPR repeat protein